MNFLALIFGFQEGGAGLDEALIEIGLMVRQYSRFRNWKLVCPSSLHPFGHDL